MFHFSCTWLALLVDASLKSLLLGVLVGTAMAVLRVRNTNARHRAWTAVLMGMLVLPLLVLVVPGVPLPTAFLPRLTLPEVRSSEAQSTTDAASPGEMDQPPKADPQLSAPLPSVVVQTPPFTAEQTYGVGPAEPSQLKQPESPRDDYAGQEPGQDPLASGTVPGAKAGAKGVLRIWPLAVVTTYLSVCVAFAFRFVVGILRTMRLVRGARGVADGRPGVSFDGKNGPGALPQEFRQRGGGALARTAVLESPSIRVPLTVGWLRPRILLPAQWRTWPATRLHAALAHELAHIRRGDYLVTLLAELNRCLYWFHPLAWYLRTCLARLAEHTCDDAVITSTGERTQYARELLAVANNLVGHRGRLMEPAAAPMARGAGVEARIAAILDFKRPLARRLGRLTSAILVGVFVPVVLVAAGLRPAGEQASAEMHETAPDKEEAGPESSGLADTKEGFEDTAVSDDQHSQASAHQDDEPTSDKQHEFSGRVLDPQGKPVAGVRLYFPRLKSQRPQKRDFIQMAQLGVTRSDGTFRVRLPAAYFRHLAGYTRTMALIAAADGYGVDWVQFEKTEPAGGLTLRLVEDQPVRGRILDKKGQPVAGASIDVKHLGASKSGRLDEFLKAWKDEGGSTDRALWLSRDALFRATTDQEGRFKIKGLGKERVAYVRVSGPNIAQAVFMVVTRDGFDPRQLNEAILRRTASRRASREVPLPADAPLMYAPTSDFVVEPAKVVQGTVREFGTGKGVSGVRVSAIAGYFSDVDALTDAAGRYKLLGLPKREQYGLHATFYGSPNREGSLVSRLVPVQATAGLKPMTADIELRRGVVVTGRIVDRATGKGVRGSVRFAPLPENKYFGQPGYDSYRHEMLWLGSDHEGRFRLVIIPGPGVLEAQTSATGPEIGGHQIDLYKQAEFTPGDRKRVTVRTLGDKRYFVGAGGTYEFLSTSNALRVLDCPEDAGTVICDLLVDRGKTLDLDITDPEGKPLTETLVCGITDCWPITFLVKKSCCTIYALDPKRPRRLIFYHIDRNLAGTLTVRGDEEQPPTVRLTPAHTLTGRAVDLNGRPVARAEVRLSVADETAEEFYRQLQLRREPVRTDADGRFRLEGALPGSLFRLVFRQATKSFVTEETEGIRVEAQAVLIAPGEVVDLGDVKVKPRDGWDAVDRLGTQLEAWWAQLRKMGSRLK